MCGVSGFLRPRSAALPVSSVSLRPVRPSLRPVRPRSLRRCGLSVLAAACPSSLPLLLVWAHPPNAPPRSASFAAYAAIVFRVSLVLLRLTPRSAALAFVSGRSFGGVPRSRRLRAARLLSRAAALAFGSVLARGPVRYGSDMVPIWFRYFFFG